MTRTEAVNLIALRCGGRTDLESRILLELIQVQENVLENSEFLPWFLLTDEVSLSISASSDLVALPDDFLLEWDDAKLKIVNSEGARIELVKDDADLLAKKFRSYDPGIPKAYALTGNSLQFFPFPDQAYECFWRYYAKGASLSADIENSWLRHASEWFCSEVTATLYAKHLNNPQQAQVHSLAAATAKQLIFIRNEARMQANRNSNLGEV